MKSNRLQSELEKLKAKYTYISGCSIFGTRKTFEKINLIVMGKSGLKTVGTEDTGSVAQYVKDNAQCQVVLVEGMPDDWADEENFLAKK